MTTRPLRWALVGASDIAATQVLPALLRIGHRAVIVQSSDAERATSYATENGIERGTDSLDEAMAADVDAVYVSTTNERHAAAVQAAAAAGRHVLCEKPLALSLDEAQGMVDVAGKAGIVLATNHHLRNAPVHRALRKLIVDGELGELLGVRVGNTNHLSQRLRGWRVAGGAGGGVVLDITVHDADTVRFVTGLEPVEVAAVGFAQGLAEGTVDAVAVAGRLTGNASMHLHDAYTVPHAPTTFEVFGTEASALASNAMNQTPDGDVVLRRTGRDDVVLDVGERENLYERGLHAFAAAVAGDGDPPCTGADGVRSLTVALAVQESLRTGKAVQIS
jgi:1,5-anhydro-D-fructose reductase (1,5-anhydro-D-mannitol-forming)